MLCVNEFFAGVFVYMRRWQQLNINRNFDIKTLLAELKPQDSFSYKLIPLGSFREKTAHLNITLKKNYGSTISIQM